MAARIADVQGELSARGLLGGDERLTPAGVATADQILSARREELQALLADHGAQREPEVTKLLDSPSFAPQCVT